MSQIVRAAVCREFGRPLVVEDLELADPGPGELLVDVAACAICHSDISYAEGAWGGELPAVYGHEASGVVEAVGAGVATVRPGDHVVVTLIRWCGQCHYCATGNQVLCEAVFPLDDRSPLSSRGSPVVQSMRSGAFAEKVVVHHSQVVAIPPDVAFDVASLLACGVITGYGAVVNTARVRSGQSVAVVGCGGVGLNAIQAAALAGADPIVAVDLSDSKLTAARLFGATHAVNSSRESVREVIQSLTDSRGVDYALVTVGAKAALDGAFGYIGKAGAVVIVGMPPSGVLGEYDPSSVAAWNQRILGSKMGETVIDRDIPRLVNLYRQGKLKLDELITGRYPLDQINQAIATVNRGEALRNVVIFD